MTTRDHASGIPERPDLRVYPAMPAPPLRPFIEGGYGGYTQSASSALAQRQTPFGGIPIVINLGPNIEVTPAHRSEPESFGAFVAGMHTSYATTVSGLETSGIQVNFTPIGAHLLFGGLPMHELTDRITPLGDVFGRAGRELVERLRAAPDWDTRFALLDAFLLARLGRAPDPPEHTAFAWQQLQRTNGQLGIGELAEELGCSRKQLLVQFRDHVGVGPKMAARIMRFSHATDLVRSSAAVNWSDIAFECGYYDQAHLIREFHEFAGCSPTEYLRLHAV